MRTKLNETGLMLFEEYIDKLNVNPNAAVPLYLLANPETSSPSGIDIDFEDRSFDSRFECGKYVTEKLEDVDSRIISNDVGFWSGLALLWFDQICPLNGQGSRKPSKAYNYVLSSDYRHYPRHAIRTSWQLVSEHGESSRFLIGKEMSIRGELVEQFMARRYFLSCKGAVGAGNKLYLDRSTGYFKKGAAARKSAGCMTRYVIWLQQINRTYDLFSISANDLYSLLPDEFDRFKKDSF